MGAHSVLQRPLVLQPVVMLNNAVSGVLPGEAELEEKEFSLWHYAQILHLHCWPNLSPRQFWNPDVCSAGLPKGKDRDSWAGSGLSVPRSNWAADIPRSALARTSGGSKVLTAMWTARGMEVDSLSEGTHHLGSPSLRSLVQIPHLKGKCRPNMDSLVLRDC